MTNVEILKSLGLPEDLADKDIKELQTPFGNKYKETKFVLEDPEINSQIIGKRMNVLAGILAKVTKKPLDTFNFDPKDSKSKKIETHIEELVTEKDNEIAKIKKELETSSDDKTKILQSQLDIAIAERDKFKKEAEDNKTAAETEKSKHETYLRNNTLQKLIDKRKEKVSFIPDMTTSQKKGLQIIIDESYDFTLNDTQDDVIVKDKTGNLVKLEGSTGYAAVEDIYKKIGTEEKLVVVNGMPAGQKKTQGREKEKEKDNDDDKERHSAKDQRKTKLAGRGRGKQD